MKIDSLTKMLSIPRYKSELKRLKPLAHILFHSTIIIIIFSCEWQIKVPILILIWLLQLPTWCTFHKATLRHISSSANFKKCFTSVALPSFHRAICIEEGIGLVTYIRDYRVIRRIWSSLYLDRHDPRRMMATKEKRRDEADQCRADLWEDFFMHDQPPWIHYGLLLPSIIHGKTQLFWSCLQNYLGMYKLATQETSSLFPCNFLASIGLVFSPCSGSCSSRE